MGQFVGVCQSCGAEYGRGFHPVCSCGGLVDMQYDLPQVRLRGDANPLVRFFDLLPLRHEESICWLGEGNTPTRHAQALGRKLGLTRLYLKDETGNPTRTTKDRMASVVLSFFRENGVSEFACSSTGNSSTSLALGVARFSGFRLHVFVGRDFLHRMNFDSSERVKVYWVRDATFAEAHECAKTFARSQPGVTSERGFFNPARREGLKLAFLEAALAMPAAPHWYVQAASSGMGVYGTWRGAQQLFRMGRIARLPRLCCVQQDTCNPMVRSWRAGSPVTRPQDVLHEPTGIAEAILRGNPTATYPHLEPVVRASGGTFLEVGEAQIREAQELLHDYEGIEACPASATTIAGIRLLEQRGELHRDDVVLANITGGLRSTEVTPAEYVTLSKADLLRNAA
jgi:threonine synthase